MVIAGEASNGAESVELIERLAPDLALLDLQMPEVHGLDVVRLLRKTRLPLVAFVTAYDEHAVRAFELNAVDYLLKPVEPSRLRQTINRAIERLEHANLHPGDAARLKSVFAGDFQTRVIELDGWLALGAQLPPKEKRGLVLIDPPFEEEGEFSRLVEGLRKAHRRWPGGIYALWYPIKDRKAVTAFRAALKETGIAKLLDIAFEIRPASHEPSLDGSGLVVANPPYTLEGELRLMLPALHKALAVRQPSRWTLDWLAQE